MNAAAEGSTRRGHADLAAAVARWALGALFLYMGLVKALDPVDFLKLVRQYELVTQPFLLNLIAATLPWFEVFCALLLLTGVAVRGAALMFVVMLVPFTVIVLHRALAIYAAQSIAFCAIRFDCGCGAGEVFICHKLAENTLLTLLALWLAVRRHHRLGLRASLFKAAGTTL
jgi:uncharacterized membrane protein YphA (DoxX/SURF4 family)